MNGEVDARKSVRGSDKEEKNNILKKMTLTLKNLFTLIKPLLLFGYWKQCDLIAFVIFKFLVYNYMLDFKINTWF